MFETIPTTSTLADRLRQRIRERGPVTFYDWMQAALYDETGGYYQRSDITRWGRNGDYRTSPERSCLFAATYARYFASLYEKAGRPESWTILEAGAGQGSFAFGVLTTLQRDFPDVFSATKYVIDEIRANSETSLQELFHPFHDKVCFKSLREVTLDPGVIFSNELLDAFPVHRVTNVNGELREFYVNVNQAGDFVWETGPTSAQKLQDYLDLLQVELAKDQIAEINPGIEDWLKSVASALKRGYLVTVDYGCEADELYSSELRPSGSLRGFRRHQPVMNLLSNPGEQDLTTSVDWTFVKRVGEAHELKTILFERQDQFLLNAGLLTQLQSEASRLPGEAERLKLTTGAREMILPNGMATSFQVLVQEKISDSEDCYRAG